MFDRELIMTCSYQARKHTSLAPLGRGQGEGVAPVSYQYVAEIWQLLPTAIDKARRAGNTARVPLGRTGSYRMTETPAHRFIAEVRRELVLTVRWGDRRLAKPFTSRLDPTRRTWTLLRSGFLDRSIVWNISQVEMVFSLLGIETDSLTTALSCISCASWFGLSKVI